MIERTHSPLFMASARRRAISILSLTMMLFAFGCGSDSQQNNTGAKYPTGISDEIGQQLKYDARVDSFDADGEDLVVNVNDTWLHSPPGMRERALGQWYSLWQPSHSKSSKIVVKYEGNEVESWTADKGYQPAKKENNTPAEG
jgi:hypothetical protein